MTISIGDRIPSSTLQHKGPEGVQQVLTDDIFRDKKVILVSVTGAFTPGCSAQHLPGFVDKSDEIFSKGVDLIACMAVNDAFVMEAWGKDQNVGDKIMMLADGSASFSRSIGMDLDLTERGMGVRSLRFAMVVEDGIVKNIFIDEPGVIENSTAEKLLDNL